MKYDKQYHVLSAIYRMARRDRWPIEVVVNLLVTRAKYCERQARAVAEVWFRGPLRADNLKYRNQWSLAA